MDPYKILGVTHSASLDTIKTNFKRLARELHPDKGGNDHMFNIIKESYVIILRNIKQSIIDKNSDELKVGHAEYLKSQEGSGGVRNTQMYNYDGDVMKKFHKVFEENIIMNDPESQGYGELMVKSEPRKKIKIDKFKKFTLKRFNKTFENSSPMNTTHLIKHYNPEPFAFTNQLSFTELGQDNITDFSGKNEGHKDLQYTDYIKAYTTNKLSSHNNKIKEIAPYKKLNEIEKDRSNIDYEMNQEELTDYTKYQISEKTKERSRTTRLKQKDSDMTYSFNKINKAMLES